MECVAESLSFVATEMCDTDSHDDEKPRNPSFSLIAHRSSIPSEAQASFTMAPNTVIQQQQPSFTMNDTPPSSSLTCTATLLPPPTTLGSGPDSLLYRDSQPAWHVSFSPDGTCLVVAYGSPHACVRVYIQDKNNQEEWILQATLRGVHSRTVRCVSFAPIRSSSSQPYIFASASFDGTVAIWEGSQSNNNYSSANTSINWECVAQLEGHDSEVKCVTWNATGSLLASCGRDKTVWIWESFLPGTVGGNNSGGDFECIAVLSGHDGDVKSVQFAASHDQWGDGEEILLSASYDDTIKVWAEEAGEWYCVASIGKVHSSTIWSIAVAPSSTRFLSGSADGSLAIYKCYSHTEKKLRFPEEADDSQNGLWKCVGKLPDAHSEAVYTISYAPARCGHGRIASGGGDNRIQVYREAMQSTSEQPQFLLDACVLTDHGDVNHVCWHPWDGSVLSSAGDDGAVRLWSYHSV